jgi:hypothetical protein
MEAKAVLVRRLLCNEWFTRSVLTIEIRLWVATDTAGLADESQELLVSADGLEPSTHALKGHCSAN